jgi:hypothetical protein
VSAHKGYKLGGDKVHYQRCEGLNYAVSGPNSRITFCELLAA